MWTWGFTISLITPIISAIFCVASLIVRYIKYGTTADAIFESLTTILLIGAIGTLIGAATGIAIGCGLWPSTQCGLLALLTAPIGFAIGMIFGLWGTGKKWANFILNR